MSQRRLHDGCSTANESRQETPDPHEGTAPSAEDAKQGDADAVAAHEAEGEQTGPRGEMTRRSQLQGMPHGIPFSLYRGFVHFRLDETRRIPHGLSRKVAC